jgi:hypothetical protein
VVNPDTDRVATTMTEHLDQRRRPRRIHVGDARNYRRSQTRRLAAGVLSLTTWFAIAAILR